MALAFLLTILLSFLLGCISTIALLIYLYTRYAFSPPVVVNESEEEQYPTFQPLPENARAKNSAVDAVNYLLQFLFQELKDSSRLRRYLLHKLDTEFKELKNSRTGKFFLQNIVIEDFSIGKECPVFSDIQLERQERDERNLIKEFVVDLDVEYKDGFFVTLDITLLFGHKCRLHVKVKRIQGHMRLEFRREPFCHWLLVFQNDPTIDFDVKSYLATRESPQLAQIITQQLRRAIKRKQTWPSYKIRFQPFFPTSEQAAPMELFSADGNTLIPGTFKLKVKHCDRLSIPLEVFDKQKATSVSVFLTVNVNKDACEQYLYIDRNRWPQLDIELMRNVHKIIVKEVPYMDRQELLIEQIEPLPDGIKDVVAFKAALEDRNLFLLKMQDQDVKTVKQVNRLLKYKQTSSTNDTTASTTTNGNEEKLKIIVGMPLLHSVRVQRAAESPNVAESDKQPTISSPTFSTRSDKISPTTNVRKRVLPTTVKFDKNAGTTDLESEQAEPADEQQQNTSADDVPVKSSSTSTTTKPKPPKSSTGDITLILMNTDILQRFQAQPTNPQKAEPYIQFDHEFDLQVSPNERYLNVCLWYKPPLDCNVINAGKKLVLLGYARIALSEIVLDTHMSFKRETQMTLNFRSPYTDKPNHKRRLELSTHKGYDDNMAHGFVTINVRHFPEIEEKLTPPEKKEQFLANTTNLTDLNKKIKEEERKQEQLKFIRLTNEQQDPSVRKVSVHTFQEKTFTVATVCYSCKRKIWMKVGLQCRDCQITIHKKCEDKCNNETQCIHDASQLKANSLHSPSDDDIKNLVNIELNNSSIIVTDDVDTMSSKISQETTLNSSSAASTRPPSVATPILPQRFSTKAAAAISALDSTARRSFRAFGNRNTNDTKVSLTSSLTSASELSKSDESLNVPENKAPAPAQPIPTTSKLASAASSAYSRFREFKSRRYPTTSNTNTTKKPPSPSAPKLNENIPEEDLRDIISTCLSDETNDAKSLEHLLHERAVDDTMIYAKAREVGQELYPDLAPDERKLKIEAEISRLQQEIDLQSQVRDELTKDYQSGFTDENEKRKLRDKIANIDEKVQALGALTILYCSGLEHCSNQMATKGTTNIELVSESLEDDENGNVDDSARHSNSDEQP